MFETNRLPDVRRAEPAPVVRRRGDYSEIIQVGSKLIDEGVRRAVKSAEEQGRIDQAASPETTIQREGKGLFDMGTTEAYRKGVNYVRMDQLKTQSTMELQQAALDHQYDPEKFTQKAEQIRQKYSGMANDQIRPNISMVMSKTAGTLGMGIQAAVIDKNQRDAIKVYDLNEDEYFRALYADMASSGFASDTTIGLEAALTATRSNLDLGEASDLKFVKRHEEALLSAGLMYDYAKASNKPKWIADLPAHERMADRTPEEVVQMIRTFRAIDSERSRKADARNAAIAAKARIASEMEADGRPPGVSSADLWRAIEHSPDATDAQRITARYERKAAEEQRSVNAMDISSLFREKGELSNNGERTAWTEEDAARAKAIDTRLTQASKAADKGEFFQWMISNGMLTSKSLPPLPERGDAYREAVSVAGPMAKYVHPFIPSELEQVVAEAAGTSVVQNPQTGETIRVHDQLEAKVRLIDDIGLREAMIRQVMLKDEKAGYTLVRMSDNMDRQTSRLIADGGSTRASYGTDNQIPQELDFEAKLILEQIMDLPRDDIGTPLAKGQYEAFTDYVLEIARLRAVSPEDLIDDESVLAGFLGYAVGSGEPSRFEGADVAPLKQGITPSKNAATIEYHTYGKGFNEAFRGAYIQLPNERRPVTKSDLSGARIKYTTDGLFTVVVQGALGPSYLMSGQVGNDVFQINGNAWVSRHDGFVGNVEGRTERINRLRTEKGGL